MSFMDMKFVRLGGEVRLLVPSGPGTLSCITPTAFIGGKLYGEIQIVAEGERLTLQDVGLTLLIVANQKLQSAM